MTKVKLYCKEITISTGNMKINNLLMLTRNNKSLLKTTTNCCQLNLKNRP